MTAQSRANVILPIGEGKPAPLSLYLFTVLESGERKSSADSLALRPVRDFERHLAERESAERQTYIAKQAAYAASEKHLTGKFKSDRDALERALKELGPMPQLPLLSIIAPSGDQTMEGLFRIYQNGRPSLAMLCDDAATFLGGHSLKSEQKVATVANLCRAWDGSKLERIRGGDGVTILYDRRLATHLMVQPGVAANFLSDAQFADQGLLARFLLSAPAGRAGTRFRNDDAYILATRATAHDLADYNAAIASLLQHSVRWKDENDPMIGVSFDALAFTGDARAMFVQFCNELETDMAPNGGLAGVKAFASKLPEQAGRIAGVLELIANNTATSVQRETLSKAVELARFYLSETLRLTAAGAIDPALRQAELLRLWLQSCRSNTITLRDAYRTGPRAIRDAKSAREAMATLADHGWVIPLEPGTVIDGQTHKEAWMIVRA